MLESGAISKIALEFVTDDDYDVQVNRSLAIVGGQLDLSRCYLFIDSEDGATTTNTHEWCADGVESQITNLADIPYSRIPGWKAILERESVYAAKDIASMPAELRALLEPQGIRAIVIVPLLVEGRVRGFLGFDECRRTRPWTHTEIETLRTLSGIIATAYSKRLLDRKSVV